MNFKDIALLDHSFDTLNDTLLRNRHEKKEDQRYEQGRGDRLAQQQQEQQFRDNELALRQQEVAQRDRPKVSAWIGDPDTLEGVTLDNATADVIEHAKQLAIQKGQKAVVMDKAPSESVDYGQATLDNGMRLTFHSPKAAQTFQQAVAAGNVKLADPNKTGKQRTSETIQLEKAWKDDLDAVDNADDADEKKFYTDRAAVTKARLDKISQFATKQDETTVKDIKRDDKGQAVKETTLKTFGNEDLKPSGKADASQERKDAQAAIARGKDPAAVKKKFKEITGQDL